LVMFEAGCTFMPRLAQVHGPPIYASCIAGVTGMSTMPAFYCLRWRSGKHSAQGDLELWSPWSPLLTSWDYRCEYCAQPFLKFLRVFWWHFHTCTQCTSIILSSHHFFPSPTYPSPPK
jgi:hypothetical protein